MNKLPEAKTCKSCDTFEILSRFVEAQSLNKLITPLKEVCRQRFFLCYRPYVDFIARDYRLLNREEGGVCLENKPSIEHPLNDLLSVIFFDAFIYTGLSASLKTLLKVLQITMKTIWVNNSNTEIFCFVRFAARISQESAIVRK